MGREKVSEEKEKALGVKGALVYVCPAPAKSQSQEAKNVA